MSLFRGLARLTRARAIRRTERLLQSLPPAVQKDIGWRWSPNRRECDMQPFCEWDI